MKKIINLILTYIFLLKVLAIGYSCGTTYLVGVEDKEILDTIRPENGKEGAASKYGSVTSLSWRSKPEEQNASTVYKNYVSFFCVNCVLYKLYYTSFNTYFFRMLLMFFC